MKIILKFNDEPELPIDVLPSVVSWAQRSNYDQITKFEVVSGVYWVFMNITKNGTKVVNIRPVCREDEA